MYVKTENPIALKIKLALAATRYECGSASGFGSPTRYRAIVPCTHTGTKAQ